LQGKNLEVVPRCTSAGSAIWRLARVVLGQAFE